MKKRGILPLISLAVAATLLPVIQVLSNGNKDLTLKLVHHFHKKANGEYPAGKADNVPRVFRNNLGYHITLKAGYVTVSQINLNRCKSALVGNAQTQIPAVQQSSLPVVESLLRADFVPLAVASLKPSPGSFYCNLFVSLEPATANATGLPKDTDIVGKTLYLRGEYVPPGSKQAVPFEVSSDRLATQAVPFHNAKGEDIKLNFTGENAPKEATIGIAYDRWLNNVDFAKMNDSVRAKTVMDNVLQSLHYHTGHVSSSASQHHSGH